MRGENKYSGTNFVIRLSSASVWNKPGALIHAARITEAAAVVIEIVRPCVLSSQGCQIGKCQVLSIILFLHS